MRFLSAYIFLLFFIAIPFAGKSLQNDSIPVASKSKKIKRYIRPCIYLNTYATPNKEILKKQRLSTYGFKSSILGVYVPLYTHTWFRKDSVTLSTLHFLATGNSETAKTNFGGLSKSPEFYKMGIGLRTIYSSGNKNVWFFDISPFMAEDNFTYLPTWRYSATIVYNRTVSENFSWRLGYTKTYLFGEGLNLPFIGCRIGPLDDAHVSIQLPRSVTFDFPMGSKFWGSIFVKPVGGRYNFIYPDSSFNKINNTIQFGHFEFISGYTLDFRPNRNISLNLSMGLVTQRHIAFADNDNANGTGYQPFFNARVAPSLFVSIGASIRFGASRKINKNYELYDVLDMNNMFDPGDNNRRPTNGDIPRNAEKVKVNNIQYQDIKDLIQETDLY